MDDILARGKAGEVITRDDPDPGKIMDVIFAAQKLIADLNAGYKTQEEVRALFSKLTGVEVDPSFCLLPPFYTDFGRNIRVGKNVFVKHCCEFMGRGGITIDDGVFIAPKVNLITVNHTENPALRSATHCAPIRIKKMSGSASAHRSCRA